MNTDAADLFCEIFDQFEAPSLDPHEVDSWMTNPQVMDISAFTEGQVPDTGTLDADEVWSTIENAEDVDQRRFAYLQGIDNALLHAHPHTASHDSAGLTAIASRYARTGKLNTNATPGALLPRYAFPAEDDLLTVENLADAMTSVVRVSPGAWAQTDHLTIPRRSDFHRLHRERGVVFGCVPFLEKFAELDWEVRQVGGAALFRTSLVASDEVRDRIDSVLGALDDSGAMVGIIPESCLSNELLAWWQEAVTDSVVPRESRLRWIFVGTGPVGEREPPGNTGIVLDRLTGEVLMKQDKLFPFHLGQDQIETWGLGDYVGTNSAREDITRGDSVTIAESALGRLCILICEDLARTMDLGPPLRDHGLSVAICPVFSDVIQMHHWEHNKAKDYADQVGTQVVVANSRAVGHNRGEVSFGTALAHSPHETDLGATSSCQEVVLFRVSDEAAIRLTGMPDIDDYDESHIG
jgi:predicted amidohydrolase